MSARDGHPGRMVTLARQVRQPAPPHLFCKRLSFQESYFAPLENGVILKGLVRLTKSMAPMPPARLLEAKKHRNVKIIWCGRISIIPRE